MNLTFLRLTILILFCSDSVAGADNTCVEWIKEKKINLNAKNCEMQCAMAEVNMGTFPCPMECVKLCKPQKKTRPPSILDRFPFYQSLCNGEKDLVKEFPLRAIQVYEAKETAWDTTTEIFGNNFRNDESDAFRHCLWSSLILMRIGVDQSTNTIERNAATDWLNAHESCSQDARGSQMDYKNNNFGTELAVRLHNGGKLIYPNLVEGCFEGLKTGKLDVISPRGVPDAIKKFY